MITTYITRGPGTSFLLLAAWPSQDAAGMKARRKGRSRWQDWHAQLWRWGLNPNRVSDPDEDCRLWLVQLAHKGERKKARTLRGPTSLRRDHAIKGFRIRIFEGRLASTYRRLVDDVIEGPEFYLTFNDARRLWADRDVSIKPLCPHLGAVVAA